MANTLGSLLFVILAIAGIHKGLAQTRGKNNTESKCLLDCLNDFTETAKSLRGEPIALEGEEDIRTILNTHYSNHTMEMMEEKFEQTCKSLDKFYACAGPCPSDPLKESIIGKFEPIKLFCSKKSDIFAQMPCVYKTLQDGYCEAELNATLRVARKMIGGMSKLLDNSTNQEPREKFPGSHADEKAFISEIKSNLSELCDSSKSALKCFAPVIAEKCGSFMLDTMRDMMSATVKSMDFDQIKSIWPDSCSQLLQMDLKEFYNQTVKEEKVDKPQALSDHNSAVRPFTSFAQLGISVMFVLSLLQRYFD